MKKTQLQTFPTMDDEWKKRNEIMGRQGNSEEGSERIKMVRLFEESAKVFALFIVAVMAQNRLI